MTTAVDFDGGWTSEDMDPCRGVRDLADSGRSVKSPAISSISGCSRINSGLGSKTRARNLTRHILDGAVAVAADGESSLARGSSVARGRPVQARRCISRNKSRARRRTPDVPRKTKRCEGCALAPRCIAHECACVYFTRREAFPEFLRSLCARTDAHRNLR